MMAMWMLWIWHHLRTTTAIEIRKRQRKTHLTRGMGLMQSVLNQKLGCLFVRLLGFFISLCFTDPLTMSRTCNDHRCSF